jgi:hypothetical protein
VAFQPQIKLPGSAEEIAAKFFNHMLVIALAGKGLPNNQKDSFCQDK